MDYDVAVVTIEATFDGHENVGAIKLQTMELTYSPARPTWCYVAGWGSTNGQSKTSSETLQLVWMQVVSQYSCASEWAPFEITSRMVCAQLPNADACYGDSGGPLVTLHGGSSTQTGMNVTFYAASIKIHPNYDDASTHNDVAIIDITGTFGDQPNIAAIALQNTDPIITAAKPTMCHATGWGLTNRKNRKIPLTLQIGYLQLITPAACRAKWYLSTITTSMICAKGDATDTCSGDSGGPLVCEGRLYGIVSWGTGNCNASKPAVFAKIPADIIRSFIFSNTGV
ncbi:trypsin beta-like [Anopheles ziemanni]|uniref:trypsin beta-like n=1 Tax=Anopheles coustani TaxID=139045 RepID=UPI00265B004C|nr:trypsin beta-like [Anopheles coustani]XP_058170566.1 trypsin beta-like [Anopheles ziemanni]